MPTWIGHAGAFAFDVAAWFFIVSFVVFPVLYARWKASERRDAAATEEALSRTRSTTDTSHIWDA